MEVVYLLTVIVPSLSGALANSQRHDEFHRGKWKASTAWASVGISCWILCGRRATPHVSKGESEYPRLGLSYVFAIIGQELQLLSSLSI